jgi:hypothetical protein
MVMTMEVLVAIFLREAVVLAVTHGASSVPAAAGADVVTGVLPLICGCSSF